MNRYRNNEQMIPELLEVLRRTLPYNCICFGGLFDNLISGDRKREIKSDHILSLANSRSLLFGREHCQL